MLQLQIDYTCKTKGRNHLQIHFYLLRNAQGPVPVPILQCKWKKVRNGVLLYAEKLLVVACDVLVASQYLPPKASKSSKAHVNCQTDPQSYKPIGCRETQQTQDADESHKNLEENNYHYSSFGS